MGTSESSENSDEMLHNMSFHQGPELFAETKTIFKAKMQFHMEIINCDLSIYTMDHSQDYCIKSEGRIF